MSYDLWEYGLRVPAMFQDSKNIACGCQEREGEQIKKIQGCCLDELEFLDTVKFQVGQKTVIVET